MESLTEKVYRALRKEVLVCNLMPGEIISEAVLAKQYAVSKTPVREALNLLRQEGLVVVLPRRGYQVASVTIKRLSDLFQLREMVEGAVAEMAAAHLGPAQLSELATAAESADASSGDIHNDKVVEGSNRFHTLLATASGNDAVTEIVARCLDELQRVFYLGARVKDTSLEGQRDHQAIVQALAARDGASARSLVIEHVRASHNHIVAQLVSSTATEIHKHINLSRLSHVPYEPDGVDVK